MVRVTGTSGRLSDISFLQLTAPWLHTHCTRHRFQNAHQRTVQVKASNAEDVEPDWETEMSIFKKRTLKPSQMEALRKLEEEKVDVGRVSNHIRSISYTSILQNNRLFLHLASVPPLPPQW